VSDQQNLTFISPRFLFPTDSGGKIRTTQVLRGLKGGAFRIKLLMPSTRQNRERYAEQLRGVCDELLVWDQAVPSRMLINIKKLIWAFHSVPIPVKSDWNVIGARQVQLALDEKPDVVVFDFPHSAVLAPDRVLAPSVMFTHNIEAEIFLRHWKVSRFLPYKLIWRDQYRKMCRFEKTVLSRFDSVVAVSERDCSFFNNEYRVEHCRTIPTGVDTGYFNYMPPENHLQIVFCGSMDWMANVDGIEYFFDDVWPLIRDKAPRAKMKVVGRAPPESLVKRIRASAPEWEFTGFVEDVRDHICGSAAFVIPLRVGGGTRIKAFEAMAMGTPVVSTSIGIEGLPVIDGEHYLGADSAATFANKVLALINDSHLRTNISELARKLVEEQYGFHRAAEAFEEICVETIERQRGVVAIR